MPRRKHLRTFDDIIQSLELARKDVQAGRVFTGCYRLASAVSAFQGLLIEFKRHIRAIERANRKPRVKR